jgi:uncharacterized coiled-coil DUF342 family protein
MIKQEVFGGSDTHFLLKKEIDCLKEELTEHLDSINENTNEIQANYEYLCRLDSKIEKLNEKFEELMLMLKHLGIKPQQETVSIRAELSEKEKDIFLVLYTASEQKPLTYADIAQIIKEEEYLTAGYITNLIEKGIPIIKRYINKTVYLALDKEFRDLQAKNNLLKISQTTVRQFV